MTVLSIDTAYLWWCESCDGVWWEDTPDQFTLDHETCWTPAQPNYQTRHVLRWTRSDFLTGTLERVVGIPSRPRARPEQEHTP